MKNSELLKGAIDYGLEGGNAGISTGSPKLDMLVGGLQKGRYDLLGGTTGSGKTAFADNFYILKPWFNLRELRKQGLTKRKLKVFYWSLEIRKVRKLAKWIGWMMFQEYRINVGLKTILTLIVDDGNLQKNRMSDELYKMIMMYLPIIDEMDEDIHIIDPPVGPNGLYAHMSNYGDAHGKHISTPVIDEGGRFLYNKSHYIPNDPELLVLGVVDHCGLMRPDKEEKEISKKAIIDKSSSYMVTLRNKYEFSFLNISQFNRELADVNRQRFKELTPQLEDFKDTGNSQEDAEVIIAGFNPFMYNMEKYKDYNIRRLGEKFKAAIVLKNRDGSGNFALGYHFEGAVGAFRELPKGTDMNDEEYRLSVQEWPTTAQNQLSLL